MSQAVLSRPTRTLEAQSLIGGEWRVGGGQKREVKSPYFGEIVGEYHEVTRSEVDQAVKAAGRAQLAWAQTPIKERSAVLYRVRTLLLERADEMSHLIALESGKTLAEGKAGLLKGVEVLEFALSLQNMDVGGRVEVSRGVYCEFRREPVGVVAGITPFNFPAMVPMWMMPIAIVLGNAFIWKPSDKTPLTSNPLAQVFVDAGLPPGVLSVLQGTRDTVENVIDHPGVLAIGFVGSTPVARSVYQRAAQNGKRVLALGGAKNHIVLMPDADPELVARGVGDSFTGCAGQRCMAASVLVAVGPCDSLLEKISSYVQQIQLGQDMGAIVNAESRDRLVKAVEQAEQDGAKVILNGSHARPRGLAGMSEKYANGFWFGPTMIDQVRPEMPVAQVELFGPVLSIIRAKTLSEALAIENQNPFGNAASIFTSSGAAAERFVREARAGMVGVNIGVPVPREPFSFGGLFESKFGHGDITGPSSLEFWGALKKITTRWGASVDHNWMS